MTDTVTQCKTMFIKLTRLDLTPIWLNASFIVTVEPRRGGGSVVVPIGDGLDYDVKEPPEKVLAMLEGVPAPAVVPVPTSDALTPTPDDVSPEPERPEPVAEPVEALAAEPPAPAEPAQPADGAEEKPARKTTRKTVAKKPRTTRKAAAKKPALELTDEQIERLKRFAPGSVRKLQNTLVTQFKVEDAEAAVKALEERGALSLERDHVNWL